MTILRIWAILLAMGSTFAWAQPPSSFPPAEAIKSQAAQLESVDSNGTALTAFSATVGPALLLLGRSGVDDAAADALREPNAAISALPTPTRVTTQFTVWQVLFSCQIVASGGKMRNFRWT